MVGKYENRSVNICLRIKRKSAVTAAEQSLRIILIMNPVFKATIEAHIDKHLEEGAWNAGSTRQDIVTVKKPIYGNVTVTTESCDCGASRIYK